MPSTFKKISLDDRCEIIKQLATLEINNDLFFAKDFSVDVLFSYGELEGITQEQWREQEKA